MTFDLPGFEDSNERLAPELVTPAVVFFFRDRAPKGRINKAPGGRDYTADIRENTGVDLGLNTSAEDIESNIDAILDMTLNVGIREKKNSE
jgi:hypothetical protein